MTTPTEEATAMYAQLKPGAVDSARQYVLSRTPAALQTIMAGLISSDLDPPPDPNSTVIHNGDAVRVVLAIGGDAPGSPGHAAIVGGTLNFVQLS